MARLFRPRMACTLEVPLLPSANATPQEAAAGPTVIVPVHPKRARLERNDHNSADELEITLDWTEAGIDPRLLRSAVASFWLGEADDYGRFRTSDETMRFIGVVKHGGRDLDEDSKNVTLRALDYTTLFIKNKPFLDEGIPNYSMTLAEAWALICDWTGYYDAETKTVTSSVAALRDRLVGRGNFDPASVGPIGAALPTRLAKLAKVQTKPATDAWAVWQQCVGSLGLISYIDGQDCVVTDASSYYEPDTTPRFIWGRNIRSMKEHVDVDATGKRLALAAYDPISHTTIEAFWPPRDMAVRVKKSRAKTKKSAGPALAPSSDYEWFTYPYGVTDEETLTRCARRAWEERSRQELRGTLITVDMRIGTELSDDRELDILHLGAGDIIRVELDIEARQTLPYLQDARTRAAWLVERRGFEPQVAEVMAKNFDVLGKLEPEFSVSRVTTELDIENESFEVSVDYCSRIQDTEAA